jgi:hypothetical protein
VIDEVWKYVWSHVSEAACDHFKNIFAAAMFLSSPTLTQSCIPEDFTARKYRWTVNVCFDEALEV